MGYFYTNIMLQTADQKGVALYLNNLQRNSFVLPETKGFITVCDEESDTFDTKAITVLANQLSKQFDCIAIAFINFDDDILWYRLYQNGNLLDEYNSNPDYFETSEHRGPIGGDANFLCKIFNKPSNVEKVEKVLRDNYVLENDRHYDLAKLLGWANPYIRLSYSELIKADDGTSDISIFAKPLSRRFLKQFIETNDHSSSFNLDKEIVKLLHRKKKISAIILFQQHTMCSLVEARLQVDEIEKRL